MAGYRELKRLKERYSLLEDWYGADCAMTEFSAASHTPQARSLAELLPEVLKEVKAPEASKLLQVQSLWEPIIGSAFLKYVAPGYFKGKKPAAGALQEGESMERFVNMFRKAEKAAQIIKNAK